MISILSCREIEAEKEDGIIILIYLQIEQQKREINIHALALWNKTLKKK